jgi:hypothetical protein
MPGAQDLSLGWLDCHPDQIYVRSTFRLAELPEHSPGPIADFLRALGRLTPSALRRILAPLLEFSFVARPMQVRRLLASGPPVACSSYAPDVIVQRSVVLSSMHCNSAEG